MILFSTNIFLVGFMFHCFNMVYDMVYGALVMVLIMALESFRKS